MAKPAKNEKTPETEAPEADAAPVVKESANDRKLRGQLEAALAEIETLKAALKGKSPAGQRAPGKRKPLAVPEKYKGTKRYRVNAPCYRKGLIEAGSVISVTNEVPSPTWTEVGNDGKPVRQEDDAK
ncbi:MAG: hypothetical protein Q8L48_16755 [Archangium sp.]|nr:hypothetical protein [Archangium sp.]